MALVGVPNLTPPTSDILLLRRSRQIYLGCLLKCPLKEGLSAMIGVLTHHWAKPDKLEDARKLLSRNGLAQSKALGFCGRQTLHSLVDPTKITTLVTWDSNEIYDAWRISSERSAIMAGADGLWSQRPQSERFEMSGP